MATWDDYTTCWLPKPGVAARYAIEFDGKGRFLMRPIDPAGESAPGAFAGGSVVVLCQMLAASVPGCAVIADRAEDPLAVGGYVCRWRELAAILNGKASVRRAVVCKAYEVRPWVSKYLAPVVGIMTPTALGLAADAKFQADYNAAMLPYQGGAKS